MKENFTTSLNQAIFSKNYEKSSLDKVFATKEVERFKELSRKPELTRSDALEMMYLLAGVETKLVNYGGEDRYIMSKYFVWIREFVSILESLFDYEEMINKKKIEVQSNTRKFLRNNMKLMQHSLKFLVDLYLVISRSTLSLGATAFRESLSNRFDVSYNEDTKQSAVVTQQPQRSLWGR